jgi:hypothetical protein
LEDHAKVDLHVDVRFGTARIHLRCNSCSGCLGNRATITKLALPNLPFVGSVLAR